MSDGMSGQGVQFKRDDGVGGFTALANVYNISGPGMTRETIEITTYDSQGYREKIGGLRDGGTLTFTMNFTNAGYDIIKGDYDNDDPVVYQIVLPDTDTTTFEFDGLVTELPLTIPEGDRITVEVSIEISGKVDVTPV